MGYDSVMLLHHSGLQHHLSPARLSNVTRARRRALRIRSFKPPALYLTSWHAAMANKRKYGYL
jgi:hypothetical protein